MPVVATRTAYVAGHGSHCRDAFYVISFVDTMPSRWDPFCCVHCGGVAPDVVPSLAHLFPDALGGVTCVDDTVCLKCNAITNRAFEQSATERLSYFRSTWGVTGRRGAPRVDARISIGDWSAPLRLNEIGDPTFAGVSKDAQSHGRAIYRIAGPEDLAHKKMAEIDRKVPGITWRTEEIPFRITVPVENDPGVLDLRRLAAKIAVERLADLRGPEFVRGAEFDQVRRFVLEGTEARPVVVPVFDSAWMHGEAALSFPIPHHAVALFCQRAEASLGAFVALFGLYHYWVVVADRYPAVADWDDLLEENPQTREVRHPSLRAGVGGLRIPWRGWVEAWTSSPDRVRTSVMAHVAQKHDLASDEYYDGDQTSP
jgi:hypothetical protein